MQSYHLLPLVRFVPRTQTDCCWRRWWSGARGRRLGHGMERGERGDHRGMLTNSGDGRRWSDFGEAIDDGRLDSGVGGAPAALGKGGGCSARRQRRRGRAVAGAEGDARDPGVVRREIDGDDHETRHLRPEVNNGDGRARRSWGGVARVGEDNGVNVGFT
jgi:hypothetical protein